MAAGPEAVRAGMTVDERIVAFLSYTHFDDEHDDRKITAFRGALEGEVRAQTGQRIWIFQDRRDIAWGEAWKERVDNSLDTAAFLIPILTPSFFTSAQCRRELDRFLKRERRLERTDLVLPVYWIEALVLEEAERSPDDLAKELAKRQRAEWRKLRFQDLGQPEARVALEKLALHIRDALGPADRETDSTRATHDSAVALPRAPVAAVVTGDPDTGRFMDLGVRVQLPGSSPSPGPAFPIRTGDPHSTGEAVVPPPRSADATELSSTARTERQWSGRPGSSPREEPKRWVAVSWAAVLFLTIAGGIGFQAAEVQGLAASAAGVGSATLAAAVVVSAVFPPPNLADLLLLLLAAAVGAVVGGDVIAITADRNGLLSVLAELAVGIAFSGVWCHIMRSEST